VKLSQVFQPSLTGLYLVAEGTQHCVLSHVQPVLRDSTKRSSPRSVFPDTHFVFSVNDSV
jgi:hypothetical protein